VARRQSKCAALAACWPIQVTSPAGSQTRRGAPVRAGATRSGSSWNQSPGPRPVQVPKRPRSSKTHAVWCSVRASADAFLFPVPPPSIPDSFCAATQSVQQSAQAPRPICKLRGCKLQGAP
jgi:hypothetical protein